jgi:hypothetical protein
MKVLLNKEVSPGSKLTGQFKIVPYIDPFYIQGEVIWIKPAKDGAAGCEVGVRFTSVRTTPIDSD